LFDTVHETEGRSVKMRGKDGTSHHLSVCEADLKGVGRWRRENGKVLTQRGQVHVFGQPLFDRRKSHGRKMDQSPDFAVLLPMTSAVLSRVADLGDESATTILDVVFVL
jgi:hypothetical protein